MDNWMELTFPSLSVNEGFARAATAAFASLLNPTIDELSDLRTAVSEAVTNAIIHAYGNDRDAMITLRCEAEGKQLKVVVKDTGCGISEEDLQKLARPYVQVGNTKARRGGTGLGLHICRMLARAMGGDMEIESELGKGSTFTITLPGVKEGKVESEKLKVESEKCNDVETRNSQLPAPNSQLPTPNLQLPTPNSQLSTLPIAASLSRMTRR